MIKLTLPIYYKDNKGTHLLGLNKYERMHYHPLNKLKQDYYKRVRSQIDRKHKISGQYTAHFKLWYKNPTCDAPNIISVIEKIAMDGLQLYNVITEDNVKYYKGATWEVVDRDIENPRVEIEVRSMTICTTH